MILFISGLLIGGFIGAFAMALAAMAGLITRDEEIAEMRRKAGQ